MMKEILRATWLSDRPTYYGLAQIVNGRRLCDQVRPLVFEGQDGPRYSSAACRNNLPDAVIQGNACVKMEDFVQLTEAAGLEKAAMDSRQIRFQPVLAAVEYDVKMTR